MGEASFSARAMSVAVFLHPLDCWTERIYVYVEGEAELLRNDQHDDKPSVGDARLIYI